MVTWQTIVSIKSKSCINKILTGLPVSMSIANGDLEKLDLIMNFCNEKILLTNRINSKTKYLNIDSICVPITKKMIQNNLFIPSNDEEKNIIDSFKKTFNNNN